MRIAALRFALAVTASLAVVSLPVAVQASPITVNNASFETLPGGGLAISCGGSCSYSNGQPIPDWAVSGTSGQFIPSNPAGNTAFFNFIPDGMTVAYSNDGTIQQTLGTTAVAGTTYILSVDFGSRKDAPMSGTATLQVGGTSVVATGLAPTPGNWSTFTASYLATALDAGDPITILLASAAAQGDWDNVRVDATAVTAVPLPGTLPLFAAGLGALGLLGWGRRKAQASA